MDGQGLQADQGEKRAPVLTLPDGDMVSLRRQLADAYLEISKLRRTVADQARLLRHLAPETHPAAPSLNCVYSLFSLAHYHEKSWPHHWNRLLPSLAGMGTMPAPEITPVVWARHLATRRAEVHKFGSGPCDHTLNVELARLKAMLNWAVTNQMIQFNPLASVKRLKTKSIRDTKLTPMDIDQLLVEAEQLRDRRSQPWDDDGMRSKMLQAAALVWHDSMMRFAEGRFLRWSLIQQNGDYTVPREVTKSDAGERTVALTERTLEAINLLPRHPRSDYVFCNPETGKPLGKTTLWRWFRWTCANSRLDAKASPRDKRIVPHHLRHAGATAADAAGVRPGALQTVLGHAGPSATARYIHRDRLDSAHHVGEAMSGLTPRTRKSMPPHRKR